MKSISNSQIPLLNVDLYDDPEHLNGSFYALNLVTGESFQIDGIKGQLCKLIDGSKNKMQLIELICQKEEIEFSDYADDFEETFNELLSAGVIKVK